MIDGGGGVLLQALVENMSDGVLAVDASQRPMIANRRFRELLEVEGDLPTPEAIAALPVIPLGTRADQPVIERRADRKLAWWSAPFAEATLLFVRDVTGRLARQRLRDDEHDLLEMIRTSARLVAFEHVPALREVRSSPELYRMFGMPDAGDGPRPDSELLPLIDPPDVEALRRAYLEGTGASELRLHVTRPDGSRRVLLVRMANREAPARVIGYVQDITDLLDLEHRVTHAEELLAEAQRMAGLGSFVFDRRTKFLKRSEGLTRLVGLLREQTAEAAFARIPDEDRGRVQDIWDALVPGAPPTRYETPLVTDEGERQLRVIVQLAADEDGHFTQVVGLVQDITRFLEDERQRQRQEAELQRANERLLRIDRQKDEFFSLVSHELRSPLAALMGYLNLLEARVGGTLTADQEHFVASLRLSAERLQRLVDDMLDLARLQAHKFTVYPRPTAYAPLVRGAIEPMRLQARGRQMELTLRLEVEPTLDLDGERVVQVLANLLDNALKFTPPGGTIGVRVHEVAGHVRTEVTDTGDGLHPDDVERVFERYEQLDAGLERRHGGLGLGLAISRGIVERHGGAMGVASEPGHGSTFWFDLPLRARDKPPYRPPDPAR